jgi:hypothetical protein
VLRVNAIYQNQTLDKAAIAADDDEIKDLGSLTRLDLAQPGRPELGVGMPVGA